MKVIILGAGVIGTTAAYFLARAGVEVVVLERESALALECSYANGAQLSYSHASPWSTYENVWKGIKWLGQRNAPLLLRPRLDWDMYRWLMKFLLNCNDSTVKKNTAAILKLNFYSKYVLEELLHENKQLKFNYSDAGILHIFRTKPELAACEQFFLSLQKMEPRLEFQNLNAAHCIEYDNSLTHAMRKRAGGILCTQDAIGNTYKFTKALEKECKALGVTFHYNTHIISLEHSSSKVKGVLTQHSQFKGDAVLVALGAYSGLFMRSYDVDLPIYPMKGYSISVPTNNDYITPKVSVTDQQKKVVFTRIGKVLRAAGTAEFAGFDQTAHSERIVPILAALKRAFPKGGDYKHATSWACLRSQTPHSYPYIDKVRFSNLFINTGHGSLGWTQALGSCKAVVDLMLKRTPEIDMKAYQV